MKPQEPRIGNYIQSLNFIFNPTPKWQEWKVTAEDLMHMEGSHPENYKGIPLTEEWLLKFGFDEIRVYESIYDYIKNQVKIQTDGESFFFIGWNQGVEIKYVHQIQNLFFSLTGEELTIK